MIPVITLDELQDAKTRQFLITNIKTVRNIAYRAATTGLFIGMGLGIITTFSTCQYITSTSNDDYNTDMLTAATPHK